MARIVERPRARSELEDIAVYIGRDRPSAAVRFVAATEKAYEMLAAMPGLGAAWEAENPAFAGVRYFPIPRFGGYVIFYRPLPDGIEVLHIFHAARDLEGFLVTEER